jgi:Zn-finger nucleic acid-binding protein
MSIWPLDPRLSGSSYRGVDPQIQGCQGCGGAWVDRRTLEAILAEAHASAGTIDPKAVPRKTMAMAEVVVYRPCPRCGVRMNRRNFGRYSGVVVDECPSCGTYFDAGELEGVVAFVRAGGLTLTEQRQAEEAKRELAHRRQLNTSAPSGVPMSIAGFSKPITQTELELLVGFLRWLGRWIRRLAR